MLGAPIAATGSSVGARVKGKYCSMRSRDDRILNSRFTPGGLQTTGGIPNHRMREWKNNGLAFELKEEV